MTKSALATLVTLNTGRVAIADAVADEERMSRRKVYWLQLVNQLLETAKKPTGEVWLRFRLLPSQLPIATSPQPGVNFCRREYAFVFIEDEKPRACIDGRLYSHHRIDELGGWGLIIQDDEQSFFIPHRTGELVAVQIGTDFISIKGFNQPFTSVNRGLFVAVD